MIQTNAARQSSKHRKAFSIKELPSTDLSSNEVKKFMEKDMQDQEGNIRGSELGTCLINLKRP